MTRVTGTIVEQSNGLPLQLAKAQRSECCTQLGTEKLRLLPHSEVVNV
jgi:hypothetical protein